MSDAAFRVEPLRAVSARLWEIERRLHVADKAALRSMGLASAGVRAMSAEDAYAMGTALGASHRNIADAVALIHDIQELIRPSLSAPAHNTTRAD